MFEVHDQEHETLSEMLSENDNWEGVDLAIVPLEHIQIEPIDLVEPRKEECRPDGEGDWLSDRGSDSVCSVWAKRKLKGIWQVPRYFIRWIGR